jgi:amicyanin
MTTLAMNVGRGSGWARWIVALAVIAVAGTAIGFGGVQWWRGQQLARNRAAIQAAPVVGVTQVNMRELAYATPHIEVAVGTTVTWTNADSAEHDVIFLNSMGNSQLLMQGQSWSHTFTSPGTYQYVCSDHPFMLGQVTVTE